MKIKAFLCVCTITFILNFSFCFKNLKSTNSLNIEKTQLTMELRSQWEGLFTQPRLNHCVSKSPAKMLAINPDYLGTKKGKNKFWWVKAWGFDASAYLFDYLDPVLRAEAVAEMKLIYETVLKFPKENPNPPPKVTVIIQGVKTESENNDQVNDLGYDPWFDPFDLKKMNSKQATSIDYTIYNKSINTPQLNQAFSKFGWAKSDSDINPGRKLVIDYDFNNDGRLSPREFVIAVMRGNDSMLGNSQCHFCFEKLVAKADAIFTFIDCDDNGLISAEDIHKGFQNLKRPTNLWNYFILAGQATIRSAVANDFVLKNMLTVKGNLTKEEFRRGILYGFWDRQTDDIEILNDDSKNLKHLRWRGNMIDIAAKKWIRAKEEKDLESAGEVAEQMEESGVNPIASNLNLSADKKMTTNDVFK